MKGGDKEYGRRILENLKEKKMFWKNLKELKEFKCPESAVSEELKRWKWE